MIRDTIIKNDVSHRVEKLEKNQVYILDTGTHLLARANHQLDQLIKNALRQAISNANPFFLQKSLILSRFSYPC